MTGKQLKVLKEVNFSCKQLFLLAVEGATINFKGLKVQDSRHDDTLLLKMFPSFKTMHFVVGILLTVRVISRVILIGL